MTIRSLSAIGLVLAALMLAGFACAQDDSALAQRQSRFNAYQAGKTNPEKARETRLKLKLDKLRAKSQKLKPTERELAKQIFSESFKLFQGGDFEEAKLGFMRGLAIDPANGRAQYYLAETLVRLKDTVLAHDHYELAQALAPNTAEGLKAGTALGKMPEIVDVEILWDCAECPEMIAIPGKNYAMGIYEVTQVEWQAVMGNNPSKFKGANLPVEKVSWNDAQEYIKKLNQKTGKNYRLPTEAEWEYACHGGSQTKYCGGDTIDNVAWYEDNSGRQTHPVGQKQANGYGLHDMSGNVWEWTNDCYEGDCTERVLCGGSLGSSPEDVRTDARKWGNGEYLHEFFWGLGFRLARTIP